MPGPCSFVPCMWPLMVRQHSRGEAWSLNHSQSAQTRDHSRAVKSCLTQLLQLFDLQPNNSPSKLFVKFVEMASCSLSTCIRRQLALMGFHLGRNLRRPEPSPTRIECTLQDKVVFSLFFLLR